VLHDVRVAWANPFVKPHGPDISVIFDVKEKKQWGTFDEAEEGTRPTLVVEVTSPSTAHIDFVDKRREYALAQLQYYVIVDQYEQGDQIHKELIGYEWTANGYVTLKPNEDGWLWLPPVQTWLTFTDDGLACYDIEGNLILDYTELTQLLHQTKARAELAETRADSAETRADSAETRAELAEKEARKEKEARQTLEAELAALKAELAKAKSDD
jgi:hypothetical protein